MIDRTAGQGEGHVLVGRDHGAAVQHLRGLFVYVLCVVCWGEVRKRCFFGGKENFGKLMPKVGKLPTFLSA